MFVSSQRHRRNPRLFYFNDKSLPMGSIPERYVSGPMTVETTLQGSGAYKTFFDMSQEKTIVSDKAVRLAGTPVNTLAEINDILKLHGATRIQFHFRRYRVTCCCKIQGQSFGSSKPTLALALEDLLQRIEKGYDYQGPNINFKRN